MKRSKLIYLDHHATTPMDPRVLREMLPFFVHRFANAASFTHSAGRDAEQKAEKAREMIAHCVGAAPREIIFTSGATESNNLALKGAAAAYRSKGRHILSAATEHKSVLDPLKRLSRQGFRLSFVRVRKDGTVDLDDFQRCLKRGTVLVSFMLANNEIGTIQPLKELVRLAKKKGALVHTDATQAVGKIPVNFRELGVDLASFTAHKMYGPKGVGALYVRKKGEAVRLIPMMDGGGHETGMRSGTLNIPGIVGFAKACEIAAKSLTRESARIRKLRDSLWKKIQAALPEAVLHGSSEQRLPNNLNFSIPGTEAGKILESMPGIALSSGSACSSTSIEPSYVLKALGVPENLRRASIRVGLGRFNTQKEIELAAEALAAAARKRFS